MNTEKSSARRRKRIVSGRADRRRVRVGLMTKRAKLRLLKRMLAKSGFDLYPKLWEMACPSCLGYTARFIWSIE